MVNPVGPAANFFLGFYNAIPSPVRLLILLSFGLAAIATIVRLIFR